MPGRKPKPTAPKVNDGNPGSGPFNPRDSKPSNTRPTCPARLSPTAKAERERLAHDLNRVRLLTLAYPAALPESRRSMSAVRPVKVIPPANPPAGCPGPAASTCHRLVPLA
jgi:hypothetical protein